MGEAQHQVDELVEEYRRQRQRAGDLQAQLAELTATATAPRQSVVVTVGPQGELTGLEFPSGAHKRMPPRELADLIVATTARAHAEVRSRAAALLAPSMPPGLDAAGLLDGTARVSDVLPAEPAMPGVVREYVDHGRPSRS